MSLKVGELFAGYSGIGMGLAQVLDAEPVWFSEFDKGPSKILAHRYPGVPNHGDITRIDWQAVEPIDILTGGFPCQDVSAAGKRAGIRPGTRSGLWSQFAYAIAQLRPRMVVIENVRGLLSAEAHSDVEPCPWCVGEPPRPGALRALGAVLGDLASLGLDAEWVGLPASRVGAPHGRWREFVVARPAQDSPSLGRECRNDSPAAVHAWRSVRPDGPGRRGDDGADTRGGLALLPTPAVNDMGEGKTPEAWDEWTAKMKAAHGNGNDHGASLSIEAQRLLPTPKATNNENRQSEGYGGRNGNFHGLLTGESSWGQYAAAIARWEALTRPAPAPTETGPKGTPRLAAPFSEWMMGLPAGWVTDVPGITRNEALKAIGNGVCVQQCAAALRWLLGVEVAA